MVCIGLTGGVGSGKSQVSLILAGLGVPIVDTDIIARDLCNAGGAALPALRAEFPPECFEESGALNRTVMRNRVFGAEHERLKLQEILHPLIRAVAWRKVAEFSTELARAHAQLGAKTPAQAQSEPAVKKEVEASAIKAGVVAAAINKVPYIVMVVPLLLESGGYEALERVVVVDCSKARQLERLRLRPNWSEATAQRIIELQASRDARLAMADDVISNEGSLVDLTRNVTQLHKKYCSLFAASVVK